jgi:hypothetical protein
MKTVKLKTATHIYAEAGTHNVTDAECARLCALGVAEPCAVVEIDARDIEAVKELKKKTAKKKAAK